MEREPHEAMNLIDNMAQNQQWSGRESSRTTGGGRLEFDQITALTAKFDAMQKAFDKMSVKAIDKQQPQSCIMCGDNGHSYEHCPLAQRDEDTEQVNFLNNESSPFPRPPFNSNNNNRNFYHNASFPISNNQASQSGPPKPYIAPAVSNFMHEEEKMNQMIFQQLDAINAQLAGLAAQNRAKEQMGYQTASNQQQPAKLPGKPEVNPRGEVMAVTLRSGTHYAPPVIPPPDYTDRIDSTRPVSDAPVGEHPQRAELTRPAQPVQTSTNTDRYKKRPLGPKIERLRQNRIEERFFSTTDLETK